MRHFPRAENILAYTALFFLLTPFVFHLAAARTASAAQHQINWENIEKEAQRLLQAVVRIDTTNPPGNETEAAQFWYDVLREEGIPASIYESEAGRGIIYGRLEGSGEKRPLILLHHLDVVPANPDEWSFDPFGGAIRDGYIHGRGAIDCKGVGVVQFLALALAKRTGLTLDRDIIFLGTGDEETGGTKGAGWFIEHHFDQIADAEYLLTEGGGIRQVDGITTYRIAVAEKAPLWLELEAKGPAGHGSSPVPETAVNRLVRALDKIRQHETPIKVVPAVERYFDTLESQTQGDAAVNLPPLNERLQNTAFKNSFTSVPSQNALVRNTISITVLDGSAKTNVVPATARAQLDCRLLPGEDAEQFVETLRHLVNDPNITFKQILNFKSVASRPDTLLFSAIQSVAAKRDTEALVLPSVLAGFTDTHYFREKGIVSYGFSGLTLTSTDARGVHGLNERIPASSLRAGVEVIFNVLLSLDATGDGAQTQ